jgi:tetratricopeptide (TPR) repeat protein
MLDFFKEYLVFVNGLLSLAVIGFVVRFSLFMKTAFKEKEDVLLKRLDALDEDLKRTEKWADRNQEELEDERDKLQLKLDQVLADANIDIHSFDLMNAVQEISSEFKSSLKEISGKIETLESSSNEDNHELNISMAKAFASNGEWYKAASQYDLATRDISDNWELYFYKGMAFANSRNSTATNLKALQAYADAIVYLPKDVDPNMRARLFIYNGAMLKRLGRIDEAEYHIVHGLKYATAHYEVNDGLYNLGCIYAMKGDDESYTECSSRLKNNDPSMHDYLLLRINDYAPEFNVSKIQ